MPCCRLASFARLLGGRRGGGARGWAARERVRVGEYMDDGGVQRDRVLGWLCFASPLTPPGGMRAVDWRTNGSGC